jgi:NADH-quinone oxidoreductase subunit H
MMFYLGEFVEIVFAACLITTLYFGGWHLPGLSALALPHWLMTLIGMGVFMAKVFVLCFVQLAVRWSVPRMRYDQLMKLGWKGMLPASIINVVLTAAWILGEQARVLPSWF